MYKVKKRDGNTVPFDLSKISAAIGKAFDATGRKHNPDVLDLVALRVTADFEPKIENDLIGVEAIQDSVEAVLIQAGYADVAKSYILYRKQHEKMRNMKSTILDYKQLVDSYVKAEDWRVKENSTVTYSVGGLILSNSGAITANYWLSEIYDEEIAKRPPELRHPPPRPRHAHGLLRGLESQAAHCGGTGRRARKDHVLPGQAPGLPLQPDGQLSGHHAERMGGRPSVFSSFDTYLAPFVKADNLTYYEVKNCIQSFVYGVNTPSRWGTQAPFSNITLDWTVPADLA